MINIKKHQVHGYQYQLINNIKGKAMLKQNKEENITEKIRQSVIETKAKKNKDKYCIKDFSGEVFELTAEMLVKERYFDNETKNQLDGIAECILRKYEKILATK